MSFRPVFHLVADHTWLNDPNGLFWHDGVWHAYFQNNPFALHWGHMSWGHATSTDLVNWQEQALAIPATPSEEAFSGCIVVDADNTSGLAAEGQENPTVLAIYTANYCGEHPRKGIQAQHVAISRDHGQTFEPYAGNPVLDRDSANFRDPHVFWFDDSDATSSAHWVLVAVEAEHQQVLIYTSHNLLDWTPASTFGPLGAIGGAWECPDLVLLTNPDTGERQWALIISINPGAPGGGSGTQYFLGDFDGATFTDHFHGWLDAGPDNYAAISYFSPPTRPNEAPNPIVQGWAASWQCAADTPTIPDGFSNSLTLPRELTLSLDAEGAPVIAQRVPSVALEQFASEWVDGVGILDPIGWLRLTCDADVRLELDGITVVRTGTDLTIERPRETNVEVNDAFPTSVSVPLPVGSADIDIFLDRNSVEIFADAGRLAATFTRFPNAINPVRLFSDAPASLRFAAFVPRRN